MGARCYSYIRFSTPHQARGDSLRRQTEASEEYAKEHGLKLDNRMKMTDLGVSAYDNSNIEAGRLGGFLKAVERREVPVGSYLLIEAFDRLSRADGFDALSLVIAIIRAAVRIVTLDDKSVYDRESVKDPIRLGHYQRHKMIRVGKGRKKRVPEGGIKTDYPCQHGNDDDRGFPAEIERAETFCL